MKINFIQNYLMDYRIKLFNQMVKDTSDLEITVSTLQDSSKERKKINKSVPIFSIHEISSKSLFFLYINAFHELDKILEDNDLIVISDNMPNIISTAYIVLKTALKKKNNLILWSEFFDKKPNDIKISIKYYLHKIYSLVLSKLSKSTLKFAKNSINGYEIPQAHDSIRDSIEAKAPKHNAMQTIGLMGDYSRRKNFDSFLKFISKNNLDYKIIIAGNWCESVINKYQSLFENKNAKIDFRGFLDPGNKKSFFEDIDCLIVPSLYEPWCLVVNEALFNNRPVLCSSYAGVSECLPREFILKHNYANFSEQLNALIKNDHTVIFEEFSKLYSIETSSRIILESINESINN